MRRSPKAPNTKEGEGSSKRMTQRKDLNPLQKGGDVMRPIHPRDQGRFSAMDLQQSREACQTERSVQQLNRFSGGTVEALSAVDFWD